MYKCIEQNEEIFSNWISRVTLRSHSAHASTTVPIFNCFINEWTLWECVLNYAFRPKYFTLSTFRLIRRVLARFVCTSVKRIHEDAPHRVDHCSTHKSAIWFVFAEHVNSEQRKTETQTPCVRSFVNVFVDRNELLSIVVVFLFFSPSSSLSSLFIAGYVFSCVRKMKICVHNVMASTPHRG